MNQKLKTDTGDNESSNTNYIKPKLATALASLEVQLDRELARYRRTRLRERKPDRSQFWASNTNGLVQSQDIATTQSNQTLTPEVENIPKEEANGQSKVSVNKVEATTPVPPHSQVNPQPSNLSRGDTKKLEIDRDDVKEKQSSEHVDSEQVDSEQSNSSQVKPKVGNIVAAEVPQNQKTQASPTGDQTIIQSPEDYLESSEELLRSFSAEKKSSKKSQAKTDIFLTPLGIASMLLLLVTCILVGWVAANPGELPKLSFGRLFKQKSDNDSDDSLIKGSSRSLTQPQITPIPKQPNLATQEFPEVKNPDDVVNLKPKPKPTPTTLEPELNPVNKPNVESNESQSSINDASVTQVDTPQATEETQKTESDAADADIKPSTDGFYHVVVDNQGEESVTKARQLIPDAYISDDGKLIHLGALKTKERAKKLVSELKSKGLNAKIK